VCDDRGDASHRADGVLKRALAVKDADEEGSVLVSEGGQFLLSLDSNRHPTDNKGFPAAKKCVDDAAAVESPNRKELPQTKVQAHRAGEPDRVRQDNFVL
jgi:hypothetical protein